jgi:nicotinamidase-related amidase
MLRTDDTTLVIIDVQGKLATLMHEREELYRNLQILVRGARILELPVLWLEQYPEGLGPTIPELAELLTDLEPMAKLSFSGCGLEEFKQRLDDSGRRTLLVAGIEAHICVNQTVCDLIAGGYGVEVVSDAVSSRTAANRQVGLDKMSRAGAGITSVETALFELLREAGTPPFKKIARLVK